VERIQKDGGFYSFKLILKENVKNVSPLFSGVVLGPELLA